jgi:diguanylate cyclase (GGDEF)-like protein
MDTNRFGRFDVLVVEPDAPATASAREALEKAGARCFVVSNIEGVRRRLAGHRIGAIVLGPSLSTRASRELLDALEFVPTSRPRLIRLSPHDPSAGRLGEHQADVVLYTPVRDAAVVAAVGMAAVASTSFDGPDVAALIRTTSLVGGLGNAMRELAASLRYAFTADACVVFGTASGEAWIAGTGSSLSQTELVTLRERVLGAARGRSVVVASEAITRGAKKACGFESYLGVRIIGDDNVRIGLIALVQCGYRAFRPEDRELLEAMGRRVAVELSFRGVNDHLLAELDATREAGGLDPLLGVWSESTLLRLSEMMVSASLRNGAPLTVAVIDVRGLARINELYGHQAGDAVLRHVAELTVYVVRASDLVARYRGGIAVVFNDTAPADAQMVVARVQRVFASEEFVVDSGVAINVETRSGMTALKEGDTAELLLQRAIDASSQARQTDEGLWMASEEQEALTPRLAIGPGSAGLRGVTLGGMYRLLHEIGSGGGGGVYRGEDLGLNRPVAIKVLNPDLAHTEEAIERFRSEAAILAGLRHPNLVQIYAFGVDAGYAYFVMELVEGESVEAAIFRREQEGTQFPLARVTSIAKHIGRALDTLHRNGIVHRDVKPANILIDPFRDRAVLVDVGIARRTTDDHFLAGTPPYMPPEMFTETEARPTVDVFAFAATIYEMLVLDKPWPVVEPLYDMIEMKKTMPPLPLRDRRPELASVDPILARGLHPDPESRYPTVKDLLSDLRRALDGLEKTTSVPKRVSAQIPVVYESVPAPRTLQSSWIATRSSIEPLSRIAVFRAFARVLGARRIARWRVDLARQDPALADALSPTKPPLGWLPSPLLHKLLLAAPRDGITTEELGIALGRASIRSTFRRFFPASPETLSLRNTLAAIDRVWLQYHSWGQIEARLGESSSATILLSETLGSGPVCGWVSGMLMELGALTGGESVEVSKISCESLGDSRCRFEVEWA